MKWELSTATAAAADGDLSAWQFLVDTGDVWHLPRWFGRMAASLISTGKINR